MFKKLFFPILSSNIFAFFPKLKIQQKRTPSKFFETIQNFNFLFFFFSKFFFEKTKIEKIK